MGHLRSIAWKQSRPDSDEFPFSVPAIRTFRTMTFADVTFFVGGNGSGKSTLLEGIASAAALPTVGAVDAPLDQTLEAQRRLGKALRLSWTSRTRKGFFLRAEDFFGFQKRVLQQQRDLQERMADIETEYAGRSEYAKGLARLPAAGELRDIARRYGEQPDARSHGEAFLNLFQGRFVAGGLYLLDEPEAALSPQSQLALLAMLFDLLKRDAQFIIATHSPIILAFPGASIYNFDRLPVGPAKYDDLEHVRLVRDFLNQPGRFLRALEEER